MNSVDHRLVAPGTWLHRPLLRDGEQENVDLLKGGERYTEAPNLCLLDAGDNGACSFINGMDTGLELEQDPHGPYSARH